MSLRRLSELITALNLYPCRSGLIAFCFNWGRAADTVITPPAPLALRLQAQLLLGVARIYSRKAKYLLDDCNDALAKVKLVRTNQAHATGGGLPC